jgi:hypothetical protein
VHFERFKSENSRAGDVEFGKVRNKEGKLRAAVDGKTNHFLATTKKYMQETQPEMKKYLQRYVGYTKISREWQHCLNKAPPSCSASPTCARQWTKRINGLGNKVGSSTPAIVCLQF